MSSVDVTIPALGVAMTEASIVRWYVEVGEVVAMGQALAEMETDKVVVDLEAPVAGTVSELLGDPGVSIDVGATVARLATDTPAAAGSDAVAPIASIESVTPRAPEVEVAATPAATVPDGTASIPTTDTSSGRRPHSLPPRARFADRTGLAPVRTAPGDSTSSQGWTLTSEISAEGALRALTEERRTGSPAVTLTDIFVSAVARASAEHLGGSGSVRLGIVVADGIATPVIAQAHSLPLAELAEERRRAVDSAWTRASALDPAPVDVVVINAGLAGPDVCVASPIGENSIVVAFGSAMPRVSRVGDGIGIRTTVSITVAAPASVRPASIRSFFTALTDKVGHR